MYQAQDGRRHMDTVGYHFYGHVVHQVDTFYRAFVLVFAALVETRHGVIEVSGMGIAGIITGVDVLEFGLCMSYGSQNTFRCDVFGELHGSWQFGSGIPTLDAVGFFQQRDVFFRIRVLDVFRHLAAGHLHVEIMSFQVKSEYRAVRFTHQFFGSSRCGADHRDGRRREGREDTGSTVFHVGMDGGAECIFGSFHKVTATSSVYMDFDTARYNVHAFGINQCGSDNGQVTICHFQNLVVTDQDRPVFQPALRGQDAGIYYLG